MGYGCYKHTEYGTSFGYGVPAECTQPECHKVINRGVSYLCGDSPYPEHGCGQAFCTEHLVSWEAPDFDTAEEEDEYYEDLSTEIPASYCARCVQQEQPYPPKPEVLEWVLHVLTDDSWDFLKEDEPTEYQSYLDRYQELTGKSFNA